MKQVAALNDAQACQHGASMTIDDVGFTILQ